LLFQNECIRQNHISLVTFASNHHITSILHWGRNTITGQRHSHNVISFTSDTINKPLLLHTSDQQFRNTTFFCQQMDISCPKTSLENDKINLIKPRCHKNEAKHSATRRVYTVLHTTNITVHICTTFS
jgi:hypothetical protein